MTTRIERRMQLELRAIVEVKIKCGFEVIERGKSIIVKRGRVKQEVAMVFGQVIIKDLRKY